MGHRIDEDGEKEIRNSCVSLLITTVYFVVALPKTFFNFDDFTWEWCNKILSLSWPTVITVIMVLLVKDVNQGVREMNKSVGEMCGRIRKKKTPGGALLDDNDACED